MSHYTVTAERGSSNVWVFQCREFPGAISEGKTLASAYDLMPEAIAFVAEVDEASVEIDLVPDLPQDVIDEVVRTVREVAELEQHQIDVAERRRRVARVLHDRHHLSGVDTATVLKVSPQRVSQLLQDA
jgi:predicted RNase H-like HicB family nuclease